MKILIEAPFKVSSEKHNLIENLIQNYSKFEDNIIQAEVFFKVGDGKDNQHAVSEIKLSLPGADIFASQNGTDSMDAFGKVYKSVETQLRRRHDKIKEKNRRNKTLAEIAMKENKNN